MKSLFNAALLKEQLKRFWIIAAVSLLCYVLLVIPPIYQANNDSTNAARMLMELISGSNMIILAAMVSLPLVTVFALFSYIFQAKSTTVMHSYPISKNQLWFTNILAGLILMIIPLLILCICLLSPVKFVKPDMAGYYYSSVRMPVELFPGGLSEGEIINTLPVVAGFFLRMVLSFAFYYAVFLTAAFVSGNAAIYVAVSAVMPFIPSALYLIGELAVRYFCFGYAGDNSSASYIPVFTNPLFFDNALNFINLTFENSTYTIYDVYPTNMYLGAIITYILIASALFTVSFICSHKRKQERASDSVVFSVLKNVLIFLLSLFGMVLMGMLLVQIIPNFTALYAGFIIGFILAYFISQMIAEKRINVLDKSRDLIKFGSVAIGIFILLAAVFQFDLFGYQNYSPDKDEVEGVSLDYLGWYFSRNLPSLIKDNYFISDREIVLDVVNIHEEIINRKKELKDVASQMMINGPYSKKYGMSASQTIAFKLKDGRVIIRRYSLPQAFMMESGLNSLLVNDAAVTAGYLSFNVPEYINRIELYYNKSEDFAESSIKIKIDNPDHIKSFLTEVKKDLKIRAEAEQKALMESTSLNDYYNLINNKINTLSGHIYLNIGSEFSEYISLGESENTSAWLIKEGYMQ